MPILEKIGIANNVLGSILDVMNKIFRSAEDFEEVLSGKQTIPAIWIGSAYIGGNLDQKTKTYNLMRDQLLLHSCNKNQNNFENITTGERIPLRGMYGLHVLKRLSLDEMPDKVTLGEKNNCTSLVLALAKYGDQVFQKVVFPGDANVHTFRQWRTEYERQLELFREADWLAPHHGSDSFKSEAESNEECVFYRILQNSNARNMIISAGKSNRYKHPYNSFVKLMQMHYEITGMPAEKHIIRYNNTDSSKDTLHFEEIEFPLYTLCTGVPVKYCMWDGPQSDSKILLADSRVFRETPRKPQEIPAPRLFFRRK